MNRYQKDLISNLDDWNQICSSLDVIGDTILSIRDYIDMEYPEKIGLQYICTYGILQALFIQQDAIRQLSLVFKLDYEIGEILSNIRKLRNASIGHPTNNNEKKIKYFNYISRMSLSKKGFSLHRSSKNNRMEIINVNLLEMLYEQLKEVKIKYRYISDKLDEVDLMHKEKYKNKLISDLFHSGMSYQFEKIGEGLRDINSNREFGNSILLSLEKTFIDFKELIEERNEMNEYIQYDLKEYFFAIEKLKNCFLNRNMEEFEINIYFYYLKDNCNHFIKIANEIDCEYKKEDR